MYLPMEIRCIDGPNGYFRLRLAPDAYTKAKKLLQRNDISFEEADHGITMSAAKYLTLTEDLFEAEGLCQKMFDTKKFSGVGRASR